VSLPGPSKRLIRFDDFEVDVHSGELRKHGLRIKLQVQPFQVLAVLLEKPGETVTREELQRCIWPADTFVDFDQGLNNAVKKLREALGDDAVNPRFVETLPKRGYRFAAQVVLADGRDGQGTFGAGGLEAQPTAPPRAGAARKAAEARQTPRGRAAWIASLAVVALFVGLAWKFEWIRPALPVGQIRSLAVLPLTNLSGDAEQEYFAEGMTDELITDLAQISALRVISRTSVMHYKGTTETMPQIARELNVDAVLEGSVQRSGDQVRIRAQLIYASTERHLWAKSYQGSLGDVLALQNEVARAIAHEIKIQVTPQEETRLANPGPVNLEAHEAYLKGRYYLNKRTEEGFRGAVQYFSEAVQKDRNYGLGYAGLADSYILLGEYSLIPAQDAFPTARNAAAKALELDDTLAEAHNALAAVKTDYDWDWSGAEGEFRRAIGLNPSYATAHQWYAELLSALGRHREALAEIRQAQQLDPFSQIINTVNGDILRTAGQLDLAIEQLRNTLEIDPNFAHAHFHLGMTYLRKGAFTEAVSEFQRAATLSPSVADYKGGLGYAYARAGNRAEARKVLDELKERSKRTYISWFYIAAIHAGLNEKDQAFACLEKAYEQREQGLAVMNREPMFDPLRSDPRFEGLLHRMGLE
jgi:TolB-like protein/DNA-binding winged helix-turn-helix (wHTH) protein/Tfp pilus assembly protein PilF